MPPDSLLQCDVHTYGPPNRKMLQLWSLGLHPLQKNPAGAHDEQPHWNSMVVAHDDARDQ